MVRIQFLFQLHHGPLSFRRLAVMRANFGPFFLDLTHLCTHVLVSLDLIRQMRKAA
jgi:hypothetical protein